MDSRIQQVYREHFERHLSDRKVPVRVRQAGDAIRSCRTAALGGHVQACPDGHVRRVWYNSCKHRVCPVCAFMRIERWVRRQVAKLLQCDYYHTIFTIPEELNILWQYNRKRFTTLLFRAAWETLRELLSDPKYLGALPGAIASFHSWGQTMWVHPHAHFLVTGGGIGPDGKWVQLPGNILLPARVLSAKFRGKFLAFLRQAELILPPEMTRQQSINLFNKLGRTKWHVMIMPPYEHGRGVIRYLGRYVKAGPISDRRIAKYDGRNVVMRYKENKQTEGTVPARRGTLTLPADEFIARHTEHVPEPGTHCVRSYGLFAHAKRELLNKARAQLGQLPVQPVEDVSWQEICAQAGDRHPEKCPVCGKELVTIEIFRSGQSPPIRRRAA